MSILAFPQPTPGPVAAGPARPASSPAPGDLDGEPTCDRCGLRAGRTHAISLSRRFCWPCFDRHLSNLPPKGGRP